MLSKSTAGAVQQSALASASASKSKSRGKGRANLGKIFPAGSALCCWGLCKWLHWKQRLADFPGSVQVTAKLGRAASFWGFLSKQLLLLGYCFAAESGYYT